MCVWLSFQTKGDLFAALRLTFYVYYKRLLHLMAIFRWLFFGFNESTRILSGLLMEALSLCEAAA